MFFGWIHFIERTTQVLAYFKHCSVVVEFITVVWRTKYRYKLLIGEEFIAVFHYLVAAYDQVEAVLAQELRDNLLSNHV